MIMKIVGIDLAGRATNPSGFAALSGGKIEARLVYSNEEIIELCTRENPELVAIDAPLGLPERGAMRKADKEMHSIGYPVLPPLFPAMKQLTLRAIDLAKKLRRKRIKVIEVHPASTRKALGMPLKNWHQIQEIFIKMGLKGEWSKRPLVPHEIDAITAIITAWLHIKGKTKEMGGRKGGFIIVPISKHWRRIAWFCT